MSRRDSFQPYVETRLAPEDSKRALAVQHSPRQNRLLAALPAEDYERLWPALEPVPVPLAVDRPRRRRPGQIPVFPHCGDRFQVLRDGERGVDRIHGYWQRGRARARGP
jgi:hypothetical protein